MSFDPMALALEWLPGNDDPERPQITLSTVTADGWPDARTVLLTAAGPEGFYFNTDARSRKAAELAADPRAAITVLWPGFTRQLAIVGVAEVAHVDHIAASYRSRSPYLQQLAWLNTAEFARLPLAEREAQWAQFESARAGVFEQPDDWTGYLVRPARLTFWESSPTTASQRREFTLVDGAWTLDYLPG
jgi:pyridoxamine 5'-phosphate oxidase